MCNQKKKKEEEEEKRRRKESRNTALQDGTCLLSPLYAVVGCKVFCDLEDRMQLHCPSIFAMLFESPKGSIAVQGE